MSPARLVLALGAVLNGTLGLAQARAGEDRTPAKDPPINAQPAVLVLRVADPPDGQKGARRIEVADPRDIAAAVREQDRRTAAADRFAYAAPLLGPEYDLIGRYTPDPRQPNVRYYIYEANLSDPFIARHWYELHRTQERAEREDRAIRKAVREWERRGQHLISANQQAVLEGAEQMQAGEYREAIITLTRASELDLGDPASRIHLAQARVAVGHDADAAKVLREALQLQPKLVAMRLGLEQYYPEEADFAQQVDALAERIGKQHAAASDEYFLLGFMEFQRGRLDEAYAAFKQAARGRPKDKLIQSYLDLTKPVKK